MMKTKVSFTFLAYPVTVRERDTGSQWTREFIFTEQDLDEMRSKGQSVLGFIEQSCERHGLEVLRTGKPTEETLWTEFNRELCELYLAQLREAEEWEDCPWTNALSKRRSGAPGGPR